MKFKQVKKFKKTKLGKIPVDWSMSKLEDHLIIKGRIGWKGLKKSEFGQNGFIIINGPNITNGKID